MVHVQQVEESQEKRGVGDSRRPKLHDQAGPSNGAKRITLASVNNPDL